MIGKTLIAALKQPGKVEVPVMVKGDVIFIFAEKSDLLRHFSLFGDNEETGMKVERMPAGNLTLSEEQQDRVWESVARSK